MDTNIVQQIIYLNYLFVLRKGVGFMKMFVLIHIKIRLVATSIEEDVGYASS